MDGFVTARDAASQLGVNYFAFLKRCRVGTFPSTVVGRARLIKRKDLERAITNANRQGMDGTAGAVLLSLDKERG